MCTLNEQLVTVRNHIKFYKCFRDEESKSMVKQLRVQEESIMSEIKATQGKARTRYIAMLLADGTYGMDVLESMDLVELRDLYEEVYPSVIRVSEARLNGSVTKTIVLKVA